MSLCESRTAHARARLSVRPFSHECLFERVFVRAIRISRAGKLAGLFR